VITLEPTDVKVITNLLISSTYFKHKTEGCHKLNTYLDHRLGGWAVQMILGYFSIRKILFLWKLSSTEKIWYHYSQLQIITNINEKQDNSLLKYICTCTCKMCVCAVCYFQCMNVLSMLGETIKRTVISMNFQTNNITVTINSWPVHFLTHTVLNI
jgi:hypothetical protein